MMSFDDFIKKYYSAQHQREIYLILNFLGIYSSIESSLNNFYRSVKGGTKNEINTQLVFATNEFVTKIYKPLLDIKQGNQNAGIERKIAELAIYLMRSTYELAGLELPQYFDLLTQTARKTYAEYNWDFSILEKLLNFENIKPFSISVQGNKNGDIVKFSKPLKLDWQGDKQLDLFVDDLTKTFQGVKAKKQIYLLFEEVKSDFKIELPSKHLLPFLTLFHDLHEYGTIKVIGNRGLFVYLHHHLQAPPNDRYPQRDFRKLRHDAKFNDKLKNRISMVIKPLLDKYCSS